MDRCLNCMQETTSDICPYCGYDRSAYELQPGALKPQTRLKGRYIIGRVLGRGGFGITYNGWDAQVGRRVAIKEYFPSGLAVRLEDHNTISAASSANTHAYKSGVVKFYDEAQILSEFGGVKEIVEIYDFFYENETSYIVMEFVDGENILQVMASRKRMDTQTAAGIILKLTDAMVKVHAQDVLHRDISPSNVLITGDGGIKLIDFGSARQFALDQPNSMSVILKNGFAPIEQYSRKGNHGPWTDTYSICATFYYMITGKMPEQATDRLIEDTLIPPSKLGTDINPKQEAVLLKGLAVRAGDRYQSASELKKAIEEAYGKLKAAVPVTPAEEQKTVALDEEPVSAHKEKTAGYMPVFITMIFTAVVILTLLSLTVWRKPADKLIQTDADAIAVDETEAQTNKIETTAKQVGIESASVTETEPKIISVAGITLNKAKLTLEKGGISTLVAETNPANASDKTVKWSTSNSTVASVDEGKVTARAAGTAVITAKTSNGKTVTCTVTVKSGVVNAESVSLNPKTYELKKGYKLTLTATVLPTDAADKKVTWTSGNTGVAEVTEGKVTALAAGTAVITARTSNGKTATCTVTVPITAVEKIIIKQTSVILNYGEKVTLKVTVLPGNADDRKATLTSSDPNVASVDGFTVTARNAGSATITVTSSNGKTTTCPVTVKTIQVTSISLNNTSLSLEVGETEKLTASIVPLNSPDKNMIWISDNTSVVSVDSNGKIIAISEGSATITAKSSNNISASCKCTVNINSKITASGTCGINAAWFLYNDGELVINGKGNMYNYLYYDNLSPWCDFRDNIKTVIISDGISSIGQYAFSDCHYLSNITIPNSVTYMGISAFSSCYRLTNITIPNSITDIGYNTFFFCGNLKNITIPNSVTYIGDGAFSYWRNSQTIYFEGRSSAPSNWSPDWNVNCEAVIKWNP